MGTKEWEGYLESDVEETENRIIFLTDAQPNIGVLNEDSLLGMTQTNAEQDVYTTFIGIGVDFNTELIEHITKIRGANYYSVHSPDQFIERMDEGFDYMVTPLVFNLQLTLEGPGYVIEKVYGSPEANEATGQVMKVNTLFPSKTEEGETRGGVILLKLAEAEEEADEVATGGPLTLSVSYEDRVGNESSAETRIELIESQPESFENSGIRKAILLTRYANLLKNWINDERLSYEEDRPIEPVVGDESGIVIPEKIELSRWERQSVPLFVSPPYREHFSTFLNHFKEEAGELQDETLDQEMDVLENLSGLFFEPVD
jgi:Ca-activated chloride channel family protein